ncbi:hypothetical protein BH11ARM2_BH11ARM2_15960 [soil metagenome]
MGDGALTQEEAASQDRQVSLRLGRIESALLRSDWAAAESDLNWCMDHASEHTAEEISDLGARWVYAMVTGARYPET